VRDRRADRLRAPVKIALVHGLERGGAHRRVASQLPFVDGSVVEVTFSTAAPFTDDAVIIPLRSISTHLPRAFKPIGRYVDLMLTVSAHYQLASTVRRLGVEVVWSNPSAAIRGSAAVWKCGAPVVYYCDEPRRVDYEAQAKATLNKATLIPYWLLRRVLRGVDRKGVSRAVDILTNSKFTAASIAMAYGRSSTVVYCGVNDYFSPDADIKLQHYLSVGTLIPTKGHDLAIRAVATAGAQLPLIVVAPRDNSDETDRLRAIAQGLGVNLEIKIGVTDGELRDLYRGAIGTLYLAQDEPFGLVSLEAQSCGSPVIAANEGGLPETLMDGVTGWVVRRDSTDASGHLKLLTEHDVRRVYSGAAIAYASEFSWERSGNELNDALCRAARSSI
jgi:glycosyltransferase involved in cell wall biosynthesis